jgi:long-subunit acyl-CoA synthetase (AMP-forming)
MQHRRGFASRTYSLCFLPVRHVLPRETGPCEGSLYQHVQNSGAVLSKEAEHALLQHLLGIAEKIRATLFC